MTDTSSNTTAANTVNDVADEHKISYCLHLADNSLIMGHRLSEWTGHGPTLEQDIAISNIALDLIGQSRNFYQYAAEMINRSNSKSETEDTLAYLRDPNDFKNIILVELPNGDWAKTCLKIFLFSSYQYFLYTQLSHAGDEHISAIAAKSLKEVTYHNRWSSEWMIRLGDGTEESKRRLQEAIKNLWEYTYEFFQTSSYEKEFIEVNQLDIVSLKNHWNKKVVEIFKEATLEVPPESKGTYHGKEGHHSENLTTILSEMQYLQRTYPGCEW